MHYYTSHSRRQDAEEPITWTDLARRSHCLGGHTLVQNFPITLPDGRTWAGTLWSTPTRRQGRRIQVQDEDGIGIFDSDDCFDQANAQNALELWLRGILDRIARLGEEQLPVSAKSAGRLAGAA